MHNESLRDIWQERPRMVFPLWDCRCFPLFYSTLSFGRDLICVQNWLGMFSFLSSPVFGIFWLKNMEKNEIRRVPILACFLVKNPGGKKGYLSVLFWVCFHVLLQWYLDLDIPAMIFTYIYSSHDPLHFFLKKS